jgi:hypothetical protein
LKAIRSILKGVPSGQEYGFRRKALKYNVFVCVLFFCDERDLERRAKALLFFQKK